LVCSHAGVCARVHSALRRYA